MRDWGIRWAASAAALAIIAQIPQLGITFDGFRTLLLATVWIGLVNSLVRPILMFLNRPLNCLTFGLSAFCINALLFATTQWAVTGFKVGLTGALLGPVLMGFISGMLSTFVGAAIRK